MQQNDLYTEYARVIEMCKGTALENTPWVCVKSYDKFYTHPQFTQRPESYQFAIAILENRPVFVGDTLYDRKGNEFKVTEDCAAIGRMIAICFWQPPKKTNRTFMLNGVELPCPVDWTESSNGDVAVIDREIFWFRTKMDADLVRDTLSKIFREARDKP